MNLARLIDIDQIVFIPLVDEEHGSILREVPMTVAEMFKNFLPDFEPDIIEVLPEGDNNGKTD